MGGASSGSNAQPRAGGTVRIYPLGPQAPAPSAPASSPGEVAGLRRRQGHLCECLSGKARRAGLRSRDWGAGPGMRRAPLPRPSRAPQPCAAGLRVLVPTPPSRSSPAAAPAHARGLAQGGERRRPPAPGPEPVRPGEPAWSCGRGRRQDGPAPRAAPARAVRVGPAEPAAGGEMSGGSAAAPQVDAPPPRGAPAPPGRPGAPAARGFGTCGQCWGAFNL